MAAVYENVRLASFTENNELQQSFNTPVRLEVYSEKKQLYIKILNGEVHDSCACVYFSVISYCAFIIQS